MKKRFVCLCMLVAALLGACSKQPTPDVLETLPYSQEKPLIASADSREEAEELAELYGITLVDFSYGIASFYTEEDPYAVIQRGEKNGWKPLSINGIQTAY